MLQWTLLLDDDTGTSAKTHVIMESFDAAIDTCTICLYRAQKPHTFLYIFSLEYITFVL